MPRISAERRESNRTAIITAARRCFSRDGFHQTSMPDIATAAGVSTGAPYRYFASKEEIILAIAGETFRVIFDPVLELIEGTQSPTVGDLVAEAVHPIARDVDDGATPVEELLRCAVQTWAEILRHDNLRARARQGFDDVRQRIAAALRQGQEAGTVSSALDPDDTSRVVMALLHGLVLQRVAFGPVDAAGFARDVRTLLGDAGVLRR